MKLVVFSHKVCWKSTNSPIGFATDGGFVFHMQALASIFDSVKILVPVSETVSAGEVVFTNHKISIVPLPAIKLKGWRRKLYMPFWFLLCSGKLFKHALSADAVHAPIPGDIGTIGMLIANLLRKPLYVRHCGNWFVTNTLAEKFWKWYMEKFAGGKNVFMTTGGSTENPSPKNKNIEWIFSSSLTEEELALNAIRNPIVNTKPLKLIIACRQDIQKGTGSVIDAIKLLPNDMEVQLDVVGDGNDLPLFKQKAELLSKYKAVVFHGNLSHNAVINTMKSADIFCYPTSASEGFPKVVLEAMSCGLPIITTPVSVLPSLISDSGCGVILKNNTPEEIAEIILSLYINKEQCLKYSAASIIKAKNFSLEKWAELIKTRLETSWKQKTLN